MERRTDHLPPGATDGFALIDSLDFPDLISIDDFLPRQHCAMLIAYHRQNVARCPSMEGGCDHFSGRVLYPAQLEPSDLREMAFKLTHDISRTIERELSGGIRVQDDGPQIVWWPAPHGMGWHRDDIVPGRAFSGLLYLNDDYEGGCTAFLDHRVKVRPRRGRLVIYGGHVQHGVEDVTKGDRFTVPSFHHLVPRPAAFVSSQTRSGSLAVG